MAKESFLEKTISILSPKRALKRAQYQKALDIMDDYGERRYEGASRGRRTKNWNATSGSANTEALFDLRVLRNRARDLVRNNPYANKAVRVLQNNIVSTGIILSLDGPDALEDALMDEWRAWAETKEIDFDGRNNFYGLQSLAMRGLAESGEMIIRKRRKRNGFPIQLQICEPDFIDESKYARTSDGKTIIQGIQFDADGRREGYWLFDQNPHDTFQAESKMIPCSEIIHLYRNDRAGQVRGIPWGAASFIRLRDYDEYEDAQLIRQKIAACFAVFVQDSSFAESGPTGGDDTNMFERVEPGIIEHVPAGKQVVFSDPPGTDGYNEYSTKVLQSVAAGYGVTYEQLTGDLSGVNFSSGRMGWLEFYREVVSVQKNILITHLCNDTFDWFLQGLAVQGKKLDLTSISKSWTPPRREMIDPVKETKAMVLAIRAGLMSYAEAVRQFGADPELLLKEIQKYNQLFDELDITLDSDPRKALPEGAANDREPSEPNE